MKDVPKPIQTTFEKLKQQHQTPLQLRHTKGHYYVNKIHTTWNKQKKQPTKHSQSIGKITPNGQYHPKKQKTKQSNTKTYQYGSPQLLLNLSKDIQTIKTNIPHINELIALSIIRATHPGPIRLAQTTWDDLYISTKTPNLNLTPKNTTNILKDIGIMTQETYDLFHDLTPQGGMLFYDLTAILSQSKRLLLAEKGYNPGWEQSGQIRVALAFSTTHLPVAIDVFYGSLKEVKILKYFKEHYKRSDLGFIMDRGFNSYELLLELKKAGIHYTVPLMKNSQFLPPTVEFEGVFRHGEKRMVACAKVGCGEYGFLYLFKDPSLGRLTEEHLLAQVFRQELPMEQYGFEQRLAGVFGIISDLDVEPCVVYEQYRAREEIEQIFDYMVNDLEADGACLEDDDVVRGFFVVVFLALRLYFKILCRLRERGLVGVVSVGEVLFVLSKMQMIVEASGREYLCALPKKTGAIYELFSDLLEIP